MITPLYHDKNNLLGPQLSFKFSITRISPDDTIILMPVRHWDKFRQYPFLTRYFFTLEDPHRTIHDIHFRQGTIVPSCIILHTTKYIYQRITVPLMHIYILPNFAPSLINISLSSNHSQNILITTLVDHICR